ncbi:MAG: calcium-binding protein [Pirellulaceae bacterium]
MEDGRVLYTSLSMDSPSDEDWYKFTLPDGVGNKKVADFKDDYQIDSPASGWQYLWNGPSRLWHRGTVDGTTNPIGDPANYQPLIYGGPLRGYTADGDDVVNNEPAMWFGLSDTGGHPGRGAIQHGGVNNEHDRYVITAFTIPEDGDYKITDSTLTGGSVRLFIHVNSDAPLMNRAGSGAFDQSLGSLTAGDTVYVAVGPNGSDTADSFVLDYSIVLDNSNTTEIKLASGSPIDHLELEVYTTDPAEDHSLELDKLQLIKASDPLDATGGNGAALSASLFSGTDYYLRVTNPNKVPTPYDLELNLTGTSNDPRTIDMSLRKDFTRRDVIIGGTGDDILRGGAGEDWIFGNAGNDVITGGYDRQASDLLFGGDGDDTFQIIPDALPLLGNQTNTQFDPATKTFIPTFSEQMIGGAGTDRILFLGGDTDRRGFDVPDYASMRYNTALHRYEFTSLVWDIGKQEYQFVDADDDGIQDTGEAFVQEYLYFQTRDTEQIQFSLQNGDDVLRLDSGFQFLPLIDQSGDLVADTSKSALYEEWGMDRGDAQQGASEQIIIHGGDGNDMLFGTPGRDIINGGAGGDTIVGGLGDDELVGDGGNDTIVGANLDASSTTSAYPFNPTTEDISAASEVYRYVLSAPFSVLPDTIRTGISINDARVTTTTASSLITDEAFGIESTSVGDELSDLRSIGDFNKDGNDDFIISGRDQSYLMFGPLRLSGLESAVELADIVIDHATLGVPHQNKGDINNDGVADLAFVRRDGSDVLVTVVFGNAFASSTSTSTTPWPRNWDATFASSLLSDSGSNSNSRRIRLSNRFLSATASPTVHLLNHTPDVNTDIFVFAESPGLQQSGIADELNRGFVFSGADVVSFQPTSTTPTINQSHAFTSIRSKDIGTLDAVVAGDVDGDGRDDILFGAKGLIVGTEAALGQRKSRLISHPGNPHSRSLPGRTRRTSPYRPPR